MRLPPLLLWLAVLSALPRPGHAGAWPREEGAVYLSLGGSLTFRPEARPLRVDPSLYLEYGLTPRVTAGLNGYLAEEGFAGNGFAFLRYALDDGTGSNRWAVGGGLGATILQDGTLDPSLRADLHWGRGLEDGWLAVDAEIVWRPASGTGHPKVEAIWGNRLDGTWTTILAGQLGTGLDGDPYGKVSAALAYGPSEQWDMTLSLDLAVFGYQGSGMTLASSIRF